MFKKILTAAAVVMTAFFFMSCEKSDSNVLKIGTSPDYPPFESQDENGKMIGFDIDLMNSLAELMEQEIEFTALDFSVIISSLNSGQVDLGVSGFTYSPDRDVLFSEPYYMSAQALVVKTGSEIVSLDELKNSRIAAQMGSTGEAAVLEAFPGAEIISLDDYMVGFEMLKSGQTEAVVCDLGVAQKFNGQKEFTMLEEFLSREEMSIIVKKGNDEMMKRINDAIIAFKKTPEYQDLLKKWELD